MREWLAMPSKERLIFCKFVVFLLYLVAFVVLPNLPYWLWLNHLAPTRALINIDYLMLGIFAVFLPRRLVIPVYISFIIIDAFVFISKLYHFSPKELMYSAGYIKYNPIGLADFASIYTVFTIIILAVAIFLLRNIVYCKIRMVSIYLALVLFLVLIADFVSGSNTNQLVARLPFYSRVQRIAINPANSGILAMDIHSLLPGHGMPVMTKIPSASEIALADKFFVKDNRSGRNFALILVESWGEVDGYRQFTDAISRPLLSPAMAQRYNIRRGSIPFRGSTTNGELRELCGLYGSYRDIFTIRPNDCLPRRFQELGYQTAGMHGFYADMFDREAWWPLLGLNSRSFMSSFKEKRRCGTAFPAICDDDLIHEMGNKLTKSHQFVYALTINSHLPLSVDRNDNGNLRCSELSKLMDEAPCMLAKKIYGALEAVSQSALRNDIKPTQFVIVGDHSPPFLGSVSDRFSETHVPYIILTPK